MLNVSIPAGRGARISIKQLGAPLTFLAILLFNLVFTKNFIATQTLWNGIVQCTTGMFLALGMTVVIATGGIDISVGSNVALSATLMTILYNQGFGVWSLVIAILCCAAFGAVAGFFVSMLEIQPLIVSLALMSTIRGVGQYISNGTVIPLTSGWVQQLAYYRVFGKIPVQVFLIATAFAAVFILTKKLRFGMYVEAYGDNPKATRLAGIRTVPLMMAVYALSGLFAGMGGIMEAARISATDPSNLGLTMEMDAIAAVAIGGTPLSGGKIHIWGTVVGVFIMQIITMTVNMNNITYEISLVLKTLVIVLAVCIQNAGSRSSGKAVAAV